MRSLSGGPRRALRAALIALHLLAAMAVAGALFLRSGARPPLPAYGEFPPFELTERSGRAVSRATFEGRPWIADFIFTRCQGQCLLLNEQGAGLRRDLPEVPLVSFSVDPEHDTPGVLRDYAARWEADDAWSFVTGPREAVNAVTTGLHLNAIDEPMMHSASFVLIDARGRVRGYYEAGDPDEMEALRRDARALRGGR